MGRGGDGRGPRGCPRSSMPPGARQPHLHLSWPAALRRTPLMPLPRRRDGTAKVGDVGMAKIMAEDYVSGGHGAFGTLAWCAPPTRSPCCTLHACNCCCASSHCCLLCGGCAQQGRAGHCSAMCRAAVCPAFVDTMSVPPRAPEPTAPLPAHRAGRRQSCCLGGGATARQTFIPSVSALFSSFS